MKIRRYYFLPWILLLLLTAGCMRMTSSVKYGDVLMPPADIVFDFTDDLDSSTLDLAIDRSLNYYNGAGRDKSYHLGDKTLTATQLKDSLLAFREIMRSDVAKTEKHKKIYDTFNIYRSAGSDGSGGVLFTGYFEPQLEGSFVKTDKFRYPLYRVPTDLVASRVSRTETKITRLNNGGSPYYSRGEIDAGGVLQGRNLEIMWVSDPVDLFFLHIQGSGKIRLTDGRNITVSASQSNGRPYKSIARNMLDKGIISGSDASYRNMKRFLKNKPLDELYEILSYNERYIFFRVVEKDPIGALGEPVTPGRTIATDPEFFPEGALAFIRLQKPVLDNEGNLTKERVSFSRFVLNQDKGSAIKGPGRVDLFCGFGETAEAMAGTLKEKGELYFLIKK